MSILVLADLHDGQLAGATAHVVAAARQIAAGWPAKSRSWKRW